MANYVKVSAVGHVPPANHPGTGQDAVDRMLTFWAQELAQVLPGRPDLILVPEACDRYPGPTIQERLAYYRTRGTQVRDFFAATAEKNRCYVGYSAARELPDGTWRNSTQIIDRDGQVAGVYDKNHLVVTEMDAAAILCGTDAPIIECDFGRVACAICFDLNFDELRARYARAKPDLILFSSMYHGGLMQGYWAYSCRAHMLTAIAGRACPCAVLSPVGHLLAESTNYFGHVSATVNLDCKVLHLDFNREGLAAMHAKYGPKVSVFDPGRLGVVLVSSETDEFRTDDLVAEFGFELLDDYFARSRAARESQLARLNDR